MSGPGTVVFGNAAQATTTATFDTPGSYVLQLSANDTQWTSTATVPVLVLAQPGTPPAVTFTLTDGMVIKGPTPIVGTVSGGAWTLAYTLTGPTPSYTTFASGTTPVTNATLGTFDPTLLLNGAYTIRLLSTDAAGQTRTVSVGVEVQGNLKIGAFTVAFTDLSVPLPGLPIQIVRTYDSRDARGGEFGPGWSLGVKSARVQKAHTLGTGWYETTAWQGTLPEYCLEPAGPRTVTITFVDGRVFRFKAVSTPKCQATPLFAVTMGFEQIPTESGTAGATLTPVGETSLWIDGPVPGPVSLLDANGRAIDYTQFVLTTAEGYEYHLDGAGRDLREGSDGPGTDVR